MVKDSTVQFKIRMITATLSNKPLIKDTRTAVDLYDLNLGDLKYWAVWWQVPDICLRCG